MTKKKPEAAEAQVETPPAEAVANPVQPKLAESDLYNIRNATNAALCEIIKTQKPLAEKGDAVAGLWLREATREHVEIRGVPLPVEAPVE